MPAQSDAPLWLWPDAVFDGVALRAGVALCVAGGAIVSAEPLSKVPDDVRPEPVAGTVTPGFVDLQVNGGGDVLFNTTPTRAGIGKIVAAYRQTGTVAILPTLITDAPSVLEHAVTAVLEARHDPGVAGMHIEGPHISTDKRGTHAARFIRPLDAETIAQVRRLRQADVAVLITVAPEAATPAQISELAGLGAVVSIGHTNANATTVQQALGAGAGAFTHLYNAMSQMQGRAPGATGAAINSDAYVGIICDGVHVADDMVGMAIRARPVADRTFLVSDGMPTVGGGDSFDLYGQTITRSGGHLVNAEGALAGAHTTISEGLQRLVNVIGIHRETALRMAISTPANLIGAGALATLVGRHLSDVIVLDSAMGFAGFLDEELADAAIGV